MKRAFVLLALVLSFVLSGAACRSDDSTPPPGGDPALDDSDDSPVAGTIQGSFAVTSTGEATYTMPLVLPPGAAGMQPSLSIVYNSASGNGLLGMGFSLSGLSTITRCAQTMAQDGRIRAVRYDQEDALCLDGARLVPVGSKGGITEYRTFPDTFAKVVAFSNGLSENPADTWKVYTRSGLVLEYGGPPNASVMAKNGVIRSWLVKRAVDRSDNTIEYSYQNLRVNDKHTVQYGPLRIQYTGHKDLAPTRLIEFEYDERAESDTQVHFTGGMDIQRSEQLASIVMRGPGDKVIRAYRFAYTTGVGSGRTLLRNIRECGADGSCKPRTTFAWKGAKPGFERIATPVEVPRSPRAAPMMLDVTGDGLDDLVVPTVPWNAAAHSEIPTTDWMITPNLGGPRVGKAAEQSFFQAPVVAYSEDNNDGKNDPVAQQQPDLEVQPDYGTPIDYNHDGAMDVLVHNVHGTAFNASNNWHILLATPEHSFKLLDTGIARPKHLVDGAFQLGNHDASVHLADLNGDGIADLLQCERDESAGGGDAFLWTLRLWSPVGPGFESAPHAVPALALFHCAWPVQTVDLDADGRVDLVLPELSQNQQDPLLEQFLLSYIEKSDAWEQAPIGRLHPSQGATVFLDLNGDGLPDIVKLDLSTGQPMTVLNTGDLFGRWFGEEIQGLHDYLPGDLTELWGLSAVIDYDGDGRQDLLVPMKESDGIGTWLVLRSRGDGTFSIIEQALPFDVELGQQGVTLANRLGPRISDVDGDGTPDVVLPIGKVFNLFRSLASQQDLLLSVHDGLNAHDPKDPGNEPTLSLTYGTLIDRTIPEGSAPPVADDDDEDYVSRGALSPACAYPIRCVVGPRRVVTRYEVNNGADHMRQFRVQYRGGRHDRRGRGFLGFHEKITSDLATGSGNIAVYGDPVPVEVDGARTYPEAGQLAEEIRWSLDPRPQDPTRIERSFASFKRELRSTGGGATYFLMTTEAGERREQGQWNPKSGVSLHAWLRSPPKESLVLVGGSKTVTTDFDSYGNVLASKTTADEVDLSTTISEVKYNNNPATWIIGRLAHQKECSSAGGLEQCKTLTRSYDDAGLLKDETVESAGDDTTFLYVVYGRDLWGNVTSTVASDKLGNDRITSATYDPSGIFPHEYTNAANHTWVATFDAGLGAMRSLVDENKLETTWWLDGFGRRVREIRPDGTDTLRTLVRAKDGGPGKNEWNVKVTTTTKGAEDAVVQYDSRARPIRWWIHGTQTGKEPPARLVQEVVFDEQGEHILRRSLPVDESAPVESRHHDEYTYDPLGRPLTHTTPWGATTRYAYEGKSVLITDPLKQPTTELYDGLGRLVSVTDPKDGVTSYSYGPFGSLWTVTDPGQAVTTTLRDAFGRVRTAIDPDKGTTILGYDGFGDLVSSLDANGRSAIFSYDGLGRRTTREDHVGNSPVQVTTWTWDTALLGTDGKRAIGALAKVESPEGTATVYTYDAFRRLVATERSIGGELFETTATYDDLGHVSTVTYPSGSGLTPFAVKNEYDAYGHLTKVRDAAGQSNGPSYFWKLTGTDEADRIAAESFGNGFVTSRTYFGDRGALKSIHTARDTEPAIQDLSYEYDAKQNLKSRHDALQPEHTTEFFQYDALDRLTCASFSSAPDCPAANRYTYSPSGNLLSKPGIAGIYTYDPAHPHAVATAGADSFGHDPVGNQISRSGTTVAYTPFDMPKSFTPAPGKGVKITLDYDGDQRRVRKTAGEEVTVYAGDLYERTTNSVSGAVEHRYLIHGSERVVAVVSRGGAASSAEKTRYLHTDHLGSIETVTDETGSKPAEKRSYDAFGARRNPHWGAPPALFSSVTTQGFTGHEDDDDLGLVNMKGRLYDPKVGRFLTPDPIVSRPRFGQSWNPYSYVLNNPLSHVDPSGFEPELLASEMPQLCSDCPGGITTSAEGICLWQGPPLPSAPPKVEAAKAGLTAAPADMKPTGNTTSPPPEPPADGAGGGSPDPRLSTGGGGADSGAIVQAQLTPSDYLGFRENFNEQTHRAELMAVLAPLEYPVVVGIVAFGLFDPDPAYAPELDTVPENRPSGLGTVVDTGVAIGVGALGVKLGQVVAESGLRSGGHLNSNAATSNFGIYEIEINGELYKVGKADLGRVTKSSGKPTRLHQQIEKLSRTHGRENVNGHVVEDLGTVTTAEAKATEAARIRTFLEKNGLVPPGNKKSFVP